TWRTKKEDLLLVATRAPIRYTAAALRERARAEPYRTALAATWRVTDLEGFLSHFLARDSLARSIALVEKGVVNTDDRNHVEFAFARSVGRALFTCDELRDLARTR